MTWSLFPNGLPGEAGPPERLVHLQSAPRIVWVTLEKWMLARAKACRTHMGLVTQRVILPLLPWDESRPVPSASVPEVWYGFVIDVELPEEVKGKGRKGAENWILVA